MKGEQGKKVNLLKVTVGEQEEKKVNEGRAGQTD